MSGESMNYGSMNYLHQQVEEAAYKLTRDNKPHRRAFGHHLLRVAQALHDVEWTDDGDYGADGDVKAIAELLGPKAMMLQLIADGTQLMKELGDQIDLARAIHGKEK